jgi:hypothetical protein
MRTGFDNRTSMGVGTVQLVAPQLTRWSFPDRDSPWDRHTGAIGIMRLVFVPEPSEFVLLVARLGFLAVLYRVRVRGSRRRV